MTAEQAGEYYIDALEEWRKKLGLKEFILAGHSFGGYISILYFEKYPVRVKQLILLSPAGTATFT
jgi:pimeloyl-ACP methyl ester carboxylesterase